MINPFERSFQWITAPEMLFFVFAYSHISEPGLGERHVYFALFVLFPVQMFFAQCFLLNVFFFLKPARSKTQIFPPGAFGDGDDTVSLTRPTLNRPEKESFSIVYLLLPPRRPRYPLSHLRLAAV